jgi:hypothetical protein
MQVATPEQIAGGTGGLVFTDPLFMRAIALFSGSICILRTAIRFISRLGSDSWLLR